MRISNFDSHIKVALLTTAVVGCVSTDNSADDLSRNDEVRKNTLVDAYQELQEWKQLQPSIVRLIELEQDLKFILDEVSNTSQTTDDFTNVDNIATGFNNFSDEPDPVQNNSEELALASNSKFSEPSFPLVNNNNVNVKPATKPLSAELYSDDAIADKFSNAQGKLLPVSNASLKPQVLRENILLASGNNEECFAAKGEFALHLVSYSQEKQIDTGWKKLKDLINPITCNRQPLVDEVVVNSKKYYSLRVGPYLTSQQVREVCSMVSKQGLYCGVAKYSGKSI